MGNLTGTVFNYRVLKCAQHSIKVLLISFIEAIDCETTQAKIRIECFFPSPKNISFSRKACHATFNFNQYMHRKIHMSRSIKYQKKTSQIKRGMQLHKCTSLV